LPSPFSTNRSCSFWTSQRLALILYSGTGNYLNFPALKKWQIL
jgi:hypothetical protein